MSARSAAVFDVLSTTWQDRTAERRGVIAVIAGQLADRLTAAGASGCELVVYELSRGLRFESRGTDAPRHGVEDNRARPTLGEGTYLTAALRLGVLDEPTVGF